MIEIYRVFHFNNGFNLRIEGIVSFQKDNTGTIFFNLTSGETVCVPPGWVASSFRKFELVYPPVPVGTIEPNEFDDIPF
jgi:hypothetical protein